MYHPMCITAHTPEKASMWLQVSRAGGVACGVTGGVACGVTVVSNSSFPVLLYAIQTHV